MPSKHASILIPKAVPDVLPFNKEKYEVCAKVIAAMEKTKRLERDAKRAALEAELAALRAEDGVPAPTGRPTGSERFGLKQNGEIGIPTLRLLCDGPKTYKEIVEEASRHSTASRPRANVANGIYYSPFGLLKTGRIRKCGEEVYEITDAGREYLASKTNRVLA